MSNLGLKIAICSMIALVGLAGLRILEDRLREPFADWVRVLLGALAFLLMLASLGGLVTHVLTA